eukprot:TRINITY_DN1972_c0_g1_i1.p1 TRINITY_DN1972_c0_g1~~TRINITY_DN1972_c0_g1_i1.p1  ORF type:complete len:177 (-),score=37.63 TRINITY_DN1972_c0_g1_i1:241-771(-)
MATLRAMVPTDLFHVNEVNLDYFTETYDLSFYFEYFLRWPEYMLTIDSPESRIMGYIMGKVEGTGTNWHGHVTAVTVGPEYRRLGLAKKLMYALEEISDRIHKAFFVDLFVRVSNEIAISMYKVLGYDVYRRVLKYYSGVEEEDALDLRKSLSRDPDKKSMIPLQHPVRPEDLEFA